MAASVTIEEESGTDNAAPVHSHKGYYAGDFSSDAPCSWTELQ